MMTEATPDREKYPERYVSFGRAYTNEESVSATSEHFMAARAEREQRLAEFDRGLAHGDESDVVEFGTMEVATNAVETYPTGAVRDTPDGKLRYDLIHPLLLSRVAEHLRLGAEHYGEHNWTKGIPSSRYMASLLRHIEQYRNGERDEDHLSAAVFNIMGLMVNETRRPELHDLYDWNQDE